MIQNHLFKRSSFPPSTCTFVINHIIAYGWWSPLNILLKLLVIWVNNAIVWWKIFQLVKKFLKIQINEETKSKRAQKCIRWRVEVNIPSILLISTPFPSLQAVIMSVPRYTKHIYSIPGVLKKEIPLSQSLPSDSNIVTSLCDYDIKILGGGCWGGSVS